VEQAYQEEWAHSEAILRGAVVTLIQQKAHDIALEVDLILQSHPYMTLKDLQHDKEFWKIAVQPVGKTGYTSLHETNTGIIRFHKERTLQNRGPRTLRRNFPTLWSIMQKGYGGKHSSGYYEWKVPNDGSEQKFIYIAPLSQKTADNVLLSVAVAATVDEFANPIKEAEAVHRKTANYLNNATEKLFRSFTRLGLLYMGLATMMISLIALGGGIYFSRAITRLREATRRVNEGDYNVSVRAPMSGEVKTLAEDFNRMVLQLAETTVSKKLLGESELRLRDANRDLEHQVIIRAAAERVLATEKERLSVTLRSIGDGVITTDRKGKIVLFNHAAGMLTGWPQSEAVGRIFTDVLQGIDERTKVPTADPVQAVIAKGETINFERAEILISKDGSQRIVALSGAPIRDNDNKIQGVVIVFRDITAHRAMEEQLLKARKLESVGTLAGGIAHDFNNLLAIILGNISFAKTLTDPSTKISQKLTEAENATLRGKELTYRLLTFSRGGEPLRRVRSLKNILPDWVNLSLEDSSVERVFLIAEDLRPVEIDEAQIQQVIHNVLLNAQEATQKGGTITIRAENVTLAAYHEIPLPEGDYIRISIEDQGGGIPEEALARIFDPYFTTKEIGNVKGMGLGLAISHSIISNHEGFMVAKSELGVGTTLQIYLPAYSGRLKDEQTGAGMMEKDGRLRILYMDDERVLREIAGQMLEHMGFEVEVASDGAEALEMYSRALESGNSFDLVIMDLIVASGMGGKDAVQKLREIDPKVKAIVSSGYANDPILKDFREHGFMGALVKPYDFQMLGKVIESVLTDQGTPN
jgi:PAS domain S-box-containing protein